MPIDPTKLGEGTPPKRGRNARNTRNAQQEQQELERVRTQSGSAIARASSNIVQSGTQSLQRLDEQLTNFEEDFADRVVDRLNQVPTRINAAIAERLEGFDVGDPLEEISDRVECFEIPEIRIPPLRLAPTPPAGMLAS